MAISTTAATAAAASTPRPAAVAGSSPLAGAATPASTAATPGGLFASHLQAPFASAPGSTAPSPRPASSSSANAAAGASSSSSSHGISVQATSIPSVALSAVAASAAASAAAASAAAAQSGASSAAAAEALQDPALFPTLLPKLEVLLELLSEAGHKTASLWEAPPEGSSNTAPTPVVAHLPPPSRNTGGGLALGSSADDELAYSLDSHLEASGERANRKPTPLNDAIVKASQQLASSYNATRAAIRALGEGSDMPLSEIGELEGTLERYEARLRALGGGREGGDGDAVMT